jgi:hypothetical protein
MSDHLKQVSTAPAQPARAVDRSAGGAKGETGLRGHCVSVAIIAVFFLAVFWRVLFLGETFVDVRTLDNQLPWGYYSGETSDYAYNRRDLTDTYITRDYFVIESYRDGETPLWNPYTMAGHPIYADGVTRIFSPFLLFYTFLDVPLGYSVARITELFLAAVFFYIFLYGIGAGQRGALIGSLVFAFSAHSMLHLTGLGWWGGLIWLPLIMLCVERAATRAAYGWAILAGVFLGAQFFCGWMQNQIYYVGAIALYYLYLGFRKIVPPGNEDRALPLRKAVLLCATTLVIGLGLAATQWVPVMELLGFSNRKIVPTEIGYIYLPPWYLATMVFPNLFGSADDARTLTLFTALNVSHDHILYIGIAAIAPLAFCIFRLKRGGDVSNEITFRARFFLLLAVISLFIMIAAPLYVHVTRYIPVLQVIRVTVRAGVLFFFAVSVLVGFGSKLLLESGEEVLRPFFINAKRFLVLTGILVIAAVAASYLVKLSGLVWEDGGSGKVAFLRRATSILSEQFTPPRVDILFPLLLLILLTFALKSFAAGRLSRRAFFATILALLSIDLFWISGQFNPTFDRSRVFPSTQITERLRALPPGRVLVAPSDLDTNRRAASGQKIIAPPNTLLPYRVSAVAGKNQQFPRWYRDYASLVEPQPYLSHVVFDQTDSGFFDLLNVRYILTREGREAPPGSEPILTAEGTSLYENKNAMPRAFLVNEVLEVRDQGEALEVMKSKEYDPRKSVVIETGRGGREKLAGGAGSAAIIEDRRNRVSIESEARGEAMLVLSDNYYPGWLAFIDGNPVEVFKANCTMRAVRVPAGRHMVSFEFAPATFRLSIYVTAATLILTGAAFTVILLRKRRRETERGI